MNSPFLFISLLFIFCLSPEKHKNQKRFTAQSFTNQTTSQRDSIPAPRGFINDFEKAFSVAEQKVLEQIIAEFEQKTTIEIAVVTIPSAFVEENDFDDFTLQLARKWGVGKKETNNGMLIGLCFGYQRIRIQNGYGIEALISDKETKEVIDSSFIPLYKEGRLYEGTKKGLESIMQLLTQRLAQQTKGSM